MTKTKTTKRALLMSVLSMMLCVAMLAGSTFAWFTDSVTSGKNKIVAGNLDVELYHTNGYVKAEEKVGADTMLFVDKDGKDGKTVQWEPGVMLYENFTVKNEGSLALKYKLTLNAVCNTADGKSLKDVLKVAIIDKAFSGDRAAAQALTFDKTVADFEKTGNLKADEAGKAGDTYAVVIYWEPSANDNDYNFNNDRKDLEKLYIELGVNLVATQTPHEYDSIDNRYDDIYTVTYKTTSDYLIGQLEYKAGEQHSLPDVSTFAKEFRPFINKVIAGSAKDVYLPTYYADKECTQPLTSLDNTAGDKTVYCKFDYSQIFEELNFGSMPLTAPYKDEYNITGETCRVSISNYGAQGLNDASGDLIFEMEKKQADGSWKTIDEKYHTYFGYEWPNLLYFDSEEDSGTYRFGRVGYAVLDAEGNEMFFLPLNVPTSLFNLTITK